MTSKTSPSAACATAPDRRRWLAAAAALLLGGCAAPAPKPPVATGTLEQAGLIDIRTVVPDIAEDIKYAGSDNFVGAPVDGYDAPTCYLLRPAAEALGKVERELRAQHRRLLLWDCYRPARAVSHFVRWGGDLADQRTKAAHYPNLDKRVLLGDYIAPRSGHSRGATADLTLMQCDLRDEHCAPLDMGTPFDYFDPLANTDSPRVTPAQRANRDLLREAMKRGGFRNYPFEWWHYTLDPEPAPDTYYDLPIR
jgi:D-alanyl-D-alanine dipeptidase